MSKIKEEMLQGIIMSTDLEKTIEISLGEYLSLLYKPQPHKAKLQPYTLIDGESWLPVQGTNNKYLISDFGRLRRKHMNKTGEERDYILTTTKKLNGYCCVRLCVDSTTVINTTVHKLVMENFNPTDNPALKIGHIDGNTENNRLDNLCYGTLSEIRAMHPKKPKLKTKEFKTKTGKIVLKKVLHSASDIEKIKELCSMGINYYKIAEIMGCSQSYVQRIGVKLKEEAYA